MLYHKSKVFPICFSGAGVNWLTEKLSSLCTYLGNPVNFLFCLTVRWTCLPAPINFMGRTSIWTRRRTIRQPRYDSMYTQLHTHTYFVGIYTHTDP
jgi:hypothetical protein